MRTSKIVLFNKPYGVVSQFTALAGKPTLAKFGLPAGIYPAGRLDHDSEGLLLLTDDGKLIKRLTDPRFGHPRTYWVQVERVPTDEAIEKLARGVVLADGKTRPCKVRRLDQTPLVSPRDPPIRHRLTVPDCWIEMILTEGKNRQVRRMTAAVGHPTLRLIRVAIGALKIESVPPGEWRHILRCKIVETK